MDMIYRINKIQKRLNGLGFSNHVNPVNHVYRCRGNRIDSIVPQEIGFEAASTESSTPEACVPSTFRGE